MKIVKLVLVLCTCLAASQFALAADGEMDGIIKFFFEQGKKAYAEKHYGDAYGWFERAQAAAWRFKNDDQVLDGIISEWMGRSCMKNNDLNRAHSNLESARAKFAKANNGKANAATARIDDLRAEVYYKKGWTEQEELALCLALDESLGEDPVVVPEPKTVPYRTERLVQFAIDHGGLSINAQYKGAYIRGRTSDDLYAYAIESLAARDRKNGSQAEVKVAIDKLFQLWKVHNDNGGTELNRSKFEACWTRVHGTSNIASPGPSYNPGPGGSGFMPRTGGWGYSSNGGVIPFNQPGSGLGGTGGSTLPGFGGGAYWSTVPGTRPISPPVVPPSNFPEQRPKGGLFLPSSTSPVYKSPFGTTEHSKSRLFDGAEEASLKAFDEKVRSLTGNQ